MQPLSAPQEFVRTKSMQAGLAVTPVRIELGEWRGLKAVQEGPVLMVGQSREIDATQSAADVASLMQWQRSASGGVVAAISIRSNGAEGMRLGVVVDALPGSAMLRLYTAHQPNAAFEIAGQRVLQNLQANADAGDHSEAGRTWWTPSSSGDQVTLEIELPPGTTPDSLKIAIPRAMHIFENLSLPLPGEDELDASTKTQPLGTPQSCHLDINCYSQYDVQSKGVARMTFVTERSADGSYRYGICTGSLLNDTQGSKTPYFLTANHCLSTQTLATALETDWFYRSTRCNSNTLSSSSVTLRNGAQLLYSKSNPDVTLLKLNDAPPAGTYFLGWNNSVVATNSEVVGIHQPAGGMQKISIGTMAAPASCTPVGDKFSCQVGGTSGNYYYVRWSQGLTEPGSSGSPLFSNGVVTGVLSAGSGATCPATDAYSMYPSLNSVFADLRQWLAPTTTPGTPSTVTRIPIYRFYNTSNGTHFFTANAAERDSIIANLRNFQYENIGFYAATQSTGSPDAVYRFFNTASSSHFFTINETERNNIQATLPGFNFEGTAWFARKSEGQSSIPMYRFFNTATGSQFFTISAAERDSIISNLKHFNFEGVAYYLWNTP